MAILESYVVNYGKIEPFFAAVQKAGVPDRVTYEFLKTLGFKSSNDRQLIVLLKGLGFLTGDGTPTDRYKSFRNRPLAKRVLAESLREAYSDIFLANTNAHKATQKEIEGIVAAKTSKGERAIQEIARTFLTVCKQADFDASPQEELAHKQNDEDIETSPSVRNGPSSEEPIVAGSPPRSTKAAEFHYNLQIHLPTTTDITVYNAIFRSLKEHLL